MSQPVRHDFQPVHNTDENFYQSACTCGWRTRGSRKYYEAGVALAATNAYNKAMEEWRRSHFNKVKR